MEAERAAVVCEQIEEVVRGRVRTEQRCAPGRRCGREADEVIELERKRQLVEHPAAEDLRAIEVPHDLHRGVCERERVRGARRVEDTAQGA
jgi:hypothetical protein